MVVDKGKCNVNAKESQKIESNLYSRSLLAFFTKRLEKTIESSVELEIGGGEVPVVGFFGIGKEGTHSAVNSARGRITPIQLSSIANPIN